MSTARLLLGIGFLFVGFVVALGQSTGPASGPATTTAASASAPTTNKVALGGITDHAARIVYVIDHSGSLIDDFDTIRLLTKRSVDNLTPEQRFAVIVIGSGDGITVIPANKLQPATTQNKKDLAKAFDEVHAPGMADDLLTNYKESFERAFALNPDVIFFLTDGQFDPRLIDVVSRLNRKHIIRVDTVAILTKEPSLIDQLQKIAKDNGGKYVFVGEKDVQNK